MIPIGIFAPLKRVGKPRASGDDPNFYLTVDRYKE